MTSTREESLSARRERFRSPEVTLHVYDLGPAIAGVNNVLSVMGSGAYHAGVEIFGSEWSFGGERTDSNSDSGVFFCAPRGCTAHVYREAVPMGKTSLTMKEVHDLLKRMMEEWLSHDYDPLRHNCCHFSDALCQALGVGQIPSWVTSLATMGAMLWRGPSLAVRSTNSNSSQGPQLRERSVPARTTAPAETKPQPALPRARSLSINPSSDLRSGWHTPLTSGFVQPRGPNTASAAQAAAQSPGAAASRRGVTPVTGLGGLAAVMGSGRPVSAGPSPRPSPRPAPSRWLMSCASASQATPRSPLQLPPLTTELSEEELACEVLRLRSQKRSHDEVRRKLDEAEERLMSLPTHAVIRLHVYLERHFGDTSLPAVQEALTKQLECLFTICQIECSTTSGQEALLDSVRQLFRDPQCFASRLCSTFLSSEDAKNLAPYLLSNVPYRRLKDKDVNSCYEALHAWISAKYWYSTISEEVTRVSAELEKQETLLGQLQGTGPLSHRTVGTTPGKTVPTTPLTVKTGGTSIFSDISGRLRSASPNHLHQKAVSIGSAVFRAMSGSPVASVLRRGTGDRGRASCRRGRV